MAPTFSWAARENSLDGYEKLVALDRFRRELDVDLVICTGDYTSLGTRAELQDARKAVEPLMQAPLGYVNVPGNHDIYVFDVLRQKRWDESFGDTFGTDLPQYVVDGGRWPFVRLVGDDVAVVAVNSARPNPQPWRSSGKIPPLQLEALERILADPVLLGRFVFVLTHYAPRAEDGVPDRRLHGLVNADELSRRLRGSAARSHPLRTYPSALHGSGRGREAPHLLRRERHQGRRRGVVAVRCRGRTGACHAGHVAGRRLRARSKCRCRGVTGADAC